MDGLRVDSSKSKSFAFFMTLLGIDPLRQTGLAFQAYATFVSIVTLLLLIVKIYFDILTNFDMNIMSIRTKTIGTVNTFVDAACNIVMSLPTLLLHKDHKLNVLADLNDVDIILGKYAKICPKQKYWQVIFNSIYFSILLGTHMYAWFNIEIFGFNFLLRASDTVQRYRISILVLYIYYALRQLQTKIILINTILVDGFNLYRFKNLPTASRQISSIMKVVEDVSKSHAKFTQTIGHFNQLFGWPIFLIFLSYITLFLLAYLTELSAISLQIGNYGMYLWLWSSMIYTMV